jgi:hypothetical protein
MRSPPSPDPDDAVRAGDAEATLPSLFLPSSVVIPAAERYALSSDSNSRFRAP